MFVCVINGQKHHFKKMATRYEHLTIRSISRFLQSETYKYILLEMWIILSFRKMMKSQNGTTFYLKPQTHDQLYTRLWPQNLTATTVLPPTRDAVVWCVSPQIRLSMSEALSTVGFTATTTMMTMTTKYSLQSNNNNDDNDCKVLASEQQQQWWWWQRLPSTELLLW